MRISFMPYPLIPGARVTIMGQHDGGGVLGISIDRWPIGGLEVNLERWQAVLDLLLSGRVVTEADFGPASCVVARPDGTFLKEFVVPDGLALGDHLVEAWSLGDLSDTIAAAAFVKGEQQIDRECGGRWEPHYPTMVVGEMVGRDTLVSPTVAVVPRVPVPLVSSKPQLGALPPPPVYPDGVRSHLARSPWPVHHTDNFNSDFVDLAGDGTYLNGPHDHVADEVPRRVVELWRSHEVRKPWCCPSAGEYLYYAGDTGLQVLDVHGRVVDSVGHCQLRQWVKPRHRALSVDSFTIVMQPIVMDEAGVERIIFVSAGYLWKFAFDARHQALVFEGNVDVRQSQTGEGILHSGGFVTSFARPDVIIVGLQGATKDRGRPVREDMREGEEPPLVGGTYVLAFDAVTLEVLDVFNLGEYFLSADLTNEVNTTVVDPTNHPQQLVMGTLPFPNVIPKSLLEVNLNNSLALGPDRRSEIHRPADVDQPELVYAIIEQNWMVAIGFDPFPKANRRHFYGEDAVEWRQFYAPAQSGSSPSLSADGEVVFIATGTGSLNPGEAADDTSVDSREPTRAHGGEAEDGDGRGAHKPRYGLSRLWALDTRTGRFLCQTRQLGEIPSSPVVTQHETPEVYVSVMLRKIYGFRMDRDRNTLECVWKSAPNIVASGVNACIAGSIYYGPVFDLSRDGAEGVVYACGFDTTQRPQPERAGLPPAGTAPNWSLPIMWLDLAPKCMTYYNHTGQVYFFNRNALHTFGDVWSWDVDNDDVQAAVAARSDDTEPEPDERSRKPTPRLHLRRHRGGTVAS